MAENTVVPPLYGQNGGKKRWFLSIIFTPIIIYTYYIDFARPITQIVFHMKCNQIQFSYYVDGSFCSILFYSV